jgi:hypothetical protein
MASTFDHGSLFFSSFHHFPDSSAGIERNHSNCNLEGKAGFRIGRSCILCIEDAMRCDECCEASPSKKKGGRSSGKS